MTWLQRPYSSLQHVSKLTARFHFSPNLQSFLIRHHFIWTKTTNFQSRRNFALSDARDVRKLKEEILCMNDQQKEFYLCNLQLALEIVLKSMPCIYFRYNLNIFTHSTPVSTTASTVNISAIVFDLIDFRVITIPDRTLPIVPKTGKEKNTFFEKYQTWAPGV